MPRPIFKYKRPFLAFMAILLFCLIVADVSIVSTHRRQMQNQLIKHWQAELDMKGVFITEALLKHEYVNVENFLLMSAKDNDNIVEINAVTPNDFVLIQYKREKPSAHTFLLEKQIRYGGRVLLDLKVVRDFEPEDEMISNLQFQLIAVSIFATIIMGMVLWFLIRRMALLPLEKEIADRRHAEELLQRAKDELEIKVQERTSELREFNDNLLLEISERKKAEEDLGVSEERLRLAVYGGGVGIWKWNVATNELDWNDQLKEIFGLPVSTTGLTLEKFMSAIHPDDLADTEGLFRKALEQQTEFKHEYRIVWPDESVHWIIAIGRGFYDQAGHPLWMLGCALDITERKQYEKVLAKIADHISAKTGAEYFDIAVKFISDELAVEYALIGELNSSGKRIKTISLYAHGKIADNIEYDLSGTPCENVVGLKLCAYPENIQELFPEDKMLVEMGAESYAGIPLFSSEGNPIGIIVVVSCKPMNERLVKKAEALLHIFAARASSEIERVSVENALAQSEKKFKNIVNASPMGMHLYELKEDDRLVLRGANPAADQILGVSNKEFIGRTIEEAFPGLIQTEVPARYRDAARHGTIWKTEQLDYDEGLIKGAFEVVAFQTGPNKMAALFNDITERKQAEEEKAKLQAQLLQAQKMESIGHLAGGIAHDFNNILSAIVGYSHIMLMKMRNDDPFRMNLEKILEASEKAASLTKSLLAFSRKQTIQMQHININDIVLGMKKLLERIVGEDIYLQVNTAFHDLIVNADANQIEQVLVNLTTNALDAMPGGGTLKVTTGELRIDEKYIKMHQQGKVGTYAFLSVTDTGMGIDEETKKHIFDPFFTTKEVGKGTGLGLSMIYGTIKQHEGFINVYSELGEGTTFKIYLPLVESGVNSTGKKDAGFIPSGTETILLVEDDEDVRKATKMLLQEFGYTVIEAIDGPQAVKLFRENKDRIQLVVSDMIMPGQSGKDLHNELMKITPGVKIIFVSGYPADILAKKGIIDNEVNFIYKPAKPDVLLKKVREVLDE